MATVLQACQLEKDSAELLEKQAKQRHMEASALGGIYVREKAREEEFPGIGFRDSIGGREAYLLGHRVAVWEVMDVYKEEPDIAEVADFYSWPKELVEVAVAY